MANIEEFKREYLKALREGYAAIFAGAGLSVSSGYVNWKELLRDLAKDIELDIDKEDDLVSVAQYYQNERGGRKSGISQKIIDELTKSTQPNENIDILTRLPIKTYWTTNYDKLIEEGLSKVNRRPDVKIIQDNLSTNKHDSDAIVYKMHGDISIPSQAVITKDDYQSYNSNRGLFTSVLQGDLISKTFLFIGFSFEDPNLESILGRLKELLYDNTRTHYCFFKEIICDDKKYEKYKQELKIRDLKRYGIEAVLVKSYDEIPNILKEIEEMYKLNNIFISGSAKEYGESWKKGDAIKLMHNLSKKLISKEYRIITGFGQGVGSVILNGVLEEIRESKYKHLEEHLCLRPFPQIESGEKSISDLKEEYREEMINESGITIFLFGNKEENTKVVNADGVEREFHIAKEQNKYIIPVASTGYVAEKIMKEVKDNMSDYSYLENHIDSLSTEKDEEKIINVIIEIINELNNR